MLSFIVKFLLVVLVVVAVIVAVVVFISMVEWLEEWDKEHDTKLTFGQFEKFYSICPENYHLFNAYIERENPYVGISLKNAFSYIRYRIFLIAQSRDEERKKQAKKTAEFLMIVQNDIDSLRDKIRKDNEEAAKLLQD